MRMYRLYQDQSAAAARAGQLASSNLRQLLQPSWQARFRARYALQPSVMS
jgi:hypothetical protein